MSNIIELENVVKTYHRGTERIQAVDGVTLSVGEGEMVFVLGPSGSGKSTLLNLIGCIEKPTEGRVKIALRDTSTLWERELARIRNTTIGFIFQQFFLLPTLTALENVTLPTLFNSRKQKNGYDQRALELLNLVRLSDRANHLPAQLSGGEMQRVAIARALINKPRILLADEPTGNLDSKNAKAIFEIFRELREQGQTIVVVTHNEELAKNARQIKLRDGKIVGSVY